MHINSTRVQSIASMALPVFPDVLPQLLQILLQVWIWTTNWWQFLLKADAACVSFFIIVSVDSQFQLDARWLPMRIAVVTSLLLCQWCLSEGARCLYTVAFTEWTSPIAVFNHNITVSAYQNTYNRLTLGARNPLALSTLQHIQCSGLVNGVAHPTVRHIPSFWHIQCSGLINHAAHSSFQQSQVSTVWQSQHSSTSNSAAHSIMPVESTVWQSQHPSIFNVPAWSTMQHIHDSSKVNCAAESTLWHIQCSSLVNSMAHLTVQQTHQSSRLSSGWHIHHSSMVNTPAQSTASTIKTPAQSTV